MTVRLGRLAPCVVEEAGDNARGVLVALCLF